MRQICSSKVWQREMREPALRFLVGDSAPLSPSSISRLNIKAGYESWAKRDLSDLKIVSVRVDGIHLKAGIAENVQTRCMLVIIGFDISGSRSEHLLAMSRWQGFRKARIVGITA